MQALIQKKSRFTKNFSQILAAKLNKKSLRLTVGGKDAKLKASAKAKWSTSNNASFVSAMLAHETVTATANVAATIFFDTFENINILPPLILVEKMLN